jgi:hypothetical protein
MLRFFLRSLAAWGAVLVLTGCPDKQPVGPADGGVVEAAPDTPPAPPPPAAFTIRYQIGDSGMESIPLAVEERPLIEPTSVIELHSSLGLRNYRVRLFDEVDRAMISDDTAEESPNGVVYRITVPTPLKSGHKYTLVLDAQTGTTFTDSLGRELQDLRLEFQIAGEKEKEKPPEPKKKKRR